MNHFGDECYVWGTVARMEDDIMLILNLSEGELKGLSRV